MSSAMTLGSNKLIVVTSLLLSMVMVAYGPMATMASAQAATNAKVQELKGKAQGELDRRIKGLEATLKSLSADVQLDKEGFTANTSSGRGSVAATAGRDGASVQADGTSGNNVSVSASQDGLTANVELSTTIKDKAKETIQKIIEKLKSLKEKVAGASQLSDIQSLATGIDSQFNLDQLTNIQGTVTKAVESLTAVFDKLKSTANDLQSQIAKLKTCTKGVAAGTGEVNAQVADGSATVSASAEGCEELKVSSDDVVESLEGQMGNISTIMSTIGSVLMSALTLLGSLVTTFSSLTGGLGNLSSLGDVSNLASLGSLSSLLSSFTGLSSQLDGVTGMAGSVQGLLGNMSGITSGFNF